VVILAAVPMHDVGGGSRSAQLALEFVRRGFHVVYVSLFGTQESIDLGVRFIHPHLEQYRLDEFDVAAVAARVAHSGLVVLEVPSPTLEPAWTALQLAGWTTIYDAVDRWADPALGGDWYREGVEQRICAAADLVLASAPDLVDHVRSLGAAAVLVPNAVNRAVFGRDPGPVPGDFPVGNGPVFGYHGSLYGDWFSWAALEEVALHYPAARVVVIGDVPRSAPEMPGNVHTLGLKSQDSLPDYVARFDVGLLPFEVTATTHAVSPLKVFELLASGVPVAAPPLRALQGIAGVVTAPRLVEAVDLARTLPRPDRIEALRSHSWEERVGRILDALDWVAPPEATLPKVVTRPAVHYARHERNL
jgi:glycosyltransferase involved in cell wall biosynthesis